MSLIEYTGTTTAVTEMVYPITGENYFLSAMPDDISSITAFGIKTVFSTTTAPRFDNEYTLTVTSIKDTFIEVTTTGTITAATLRIKTKEGLTGTWSSSYLPTETTLISGANYHFSTTTTYTIGDSWEFKIYPLEIITYTPLNDYQLYVNMSNSKIYSTGDTLYDRIAVSYNALGTILRVTDTLVPTFVYKINSETTPLYKGDGVYVYSATGVKKWMDSGTNTNNPYGFAMETIYAGKSGRIQIAGEAKLFSGLTAGEKYVVEDSGTIATSSTYSVVCGLAVDAETLLITRESLK